MLPDRAGRANTALIAAMAALMGGLWCAIALSSAAAQPPQTAAGAGSQQAAVRPLGRSLSVSRVTVGSAAQVVALPDGRVFVNDPVRRQLVLLDADLATARIVLDSTAGRDHSYGAFAGFLAPFAADSVLFHERSANAYLVLDPDGRIARTLAPPPVPGGLVPTPLSVHFAPAFGIVRALAVFPAGFGRRPPDLRIAQGQPRAEFRYADSTFLLATDPATRQVDTLGRLSTGRTLIRFFTWNGEGGVTDPRPFPFYDVPLMMTDGSIAIFRAGDYRVEWITPDGTRSMTPRLAHQWRRLSDDERQRLVDSVNASRRANFEARLTAWVSDSAAGRLPVTTRVISVNGVPTPRDFTPARPVLGNLVMLDDVSDFLPPTGPDAVFADGENRVWIAPLSANQGGPGEPTLFEVIDRSGVVADRVRVPAGKRIVAFVGSTVVLASADGGEVTLERVSIR